MTQTAKRKPLTDKEERVLAYAQLMGVEVASMARIANRMRAQALEQENAQTAARVIAGYEWTVVSVGQPKLRSVYEIRDTVTGWSWHCRGTGRGSSSWYHSGAQYEVTWTAPSGESHTETHDVSQVRDMPLRLLPERDRALYSMIRDINGRDWDFELKRYRRQAKKSSDRVKSS